MSNYLNMKRMKVKVERIEPLAYGGSWMIGWEY